MPAFAYSWNGSSIVNWFGMPLAYALRTKPYEVTITIRTALRVWVTVLFRFKNIENWKNFIHFLAYIKKKQYLCSPK